MQKMGKASSDAANTKQMRLFTGKLRLAVLAVFCCILWGSAYPVIKVCYLQMRITTPFEMILFAGLRFTAAGMMVMLFTRFVLKIKILPCKEEWPMIVILALIQTFAAYLLSYLGANNTTAAKASIMSAAELFLTTGIAHFFFYDDRLNLRKILGLVFGFAGIVVANLSGLKNISWVFSFNGEGFILLCSICISASFVYVKKKSGQMNLLRINGWQLLLGGLLLSAAGTAGSTKGLSFTWESVWLLGYLAILSAAAFSIWFLLLKYNHASEVTIYKAIMPVVGVALSVILLSGEQLTWFALAGLLLVVAGIMITNANRKHNKTGL